MRALAVLSAAVAVGGGAAIDASCYTACAPEAAGDACFMACGLCSTPDLAFWINASAAGGLCAAPTQPPPGVDVPTVLTAAVLNMSATIQGQFWLADPADPSLPENNYTVALTYLLRYAPRRDLIALYAAPLAWTDFLIEHVRLALWAYSQFSASLGVTWADFLDYVLPYAVADEPRDVHFRWRPRYYQALMPLVAASGAATVLDAYKALVAAMPSVQILGVVGTGPDNQAFFPGAPSTWRSESSPARLSPQQVAQFGGSCTGTAISQIAAARSVGLPVRLAGCSESVVRGDDHHWSEVIDRKSPPGPFGSFWHTREGSSRGNEGGPWDAPSGPMSGCLQGVIPGSQMDSLWATRWGTTQNLPLLWTGSDALTITWARINGENVCGAYCTAWGCGANNTNKWSQAQCGPNTTSTAA